MVICKRTIAFALLLSLALLVTASAVLAGKDETAQQWIERRSVVAERPQDPAVEQKLQAAAAAAAAVQAKLEAEQAAQIKKPVSFSTRNNFMGAASIAGHFKNNYDPRAVYFSEDFEDLDNFPPIGWDTINTDPGYGFFSGTYSGGGTRAALVTWHAPGFVQDEWMISPSADLSAAGSDIRLEFWFLKGYAYPHEFKVYVATDGATFDLVWDSDVDGAGYPNFTWTQGTVDMSAYIGEASVTVGFQYYGVDADLFGLDDVVLTDEGAATGRCCSGDINDPTCTEGLTLAECDALSGSWLAGGNCTDNACPVAGPDDNCADVTPQALPHTFVGNNEGATFDTECQYFVEYPNSWIAFTISECTNITLSYCGTQAGWGNGWLNMVTACDCATLISGATFDFNCANGNPNIYFSHLPAGTYYYPVMLDPSNGASGDWSIEVTGVTCPPSTPGDNCLDPETVDLPGELPYANSNHTCGRVNDYTETCLGSYDGGEDMVYEITVTSPVTVDITLDPLGTAWVGFSVDDMCPADGSCLVVKTNGGSTSPMTAPGVALAPGTYYLMVDTWPTPDCIPAFNLSITEATAGNVGDNCGNPLKIDIPTLPYSDLGQTTCGRLNHYDATCLGSYDGGEDIIYEVTVTSPVTVDITLDPLGTDYTGIVIDAVCPPGSAGCIGTSTSSGTTAHTIYAVSLAVGTYYIMVDTWPAPNCIPSFDLHITEAGAGPANDNWEDAEKVDDLLDYPFCTAGASFDGSGGCQAQPNVWYCYTASCDGNVTVDLCGSGYDTYLGAYDGCGEPTAGNRLACNDDDCGLQSSVTFSAVAGNEYLIEVGGYSGVGCGDISISCAAPCVVTCPSGATDEGEPCGTDANGGCNMATPAFRPIACGETVCGTGWFDGATRDTDWYLLTLDGYYDVTWTVQAEFNALIGPVWTSGAPGTIICPAVSIDPAGFPLACETGSVTFTAGPGSYILFVAPTFENLVVCPGDYWARATCVPVAPPADYCDAGSNFVGCDEYISNVTVGSINNSSGCINYSDYTSITTSMDVEVSYPISVSNGNPYAEDQCGIWVDWNHDADFFDANEAIAVSGNPGVGPYTGNITPPASALAGPTRMRVRLTWVGAVSPCGFTSYGEVEDYTVTVIPSSSPFQIALEPDPIYAAMANPIEPHCVDIYLAGTITPGHGPGDVNQSSLLINGVPAVQSELLTSYPGFDGTVLHICADMATFVGGYGVLYGTTTQSYTVSGTMSDASAFSVPDNFSFVGHISGDVNMDRKVNVLDLTYIVERIFRGGPMFLDPIAADINADGSQGNVMDLTYIIDFFFRGGPPPAQLD